jgi:lipopolysaccharide/colanic/teichoic acid biosynthesis glycosyltransferase
MSWLQWMFGKARSVRAGKDSQWLVDRDQFQVHLERERMRVDRNGSLFSLIVICCADGGTAESNERLAGILRQRIRATDLAGWFDARRIGLLLPDTPSAGAAKLAADLSKFYEPDEPVPLFDIYTHPLDEFAQAEAAEKAARQKLAGRQQTAPQAIQRLMLRPIPWWKRALDVVGASAGLVLLAPLLATVAAAIKFTSPGPVLFMQQREGYGGRIFTMYKFRTMCVDAEAQKNALRPMSEQDGPAFKLANDPRVTALGHYLRKTCIDELPQLWNVLRGEMSLVGPRPLPVDESRRCLVWQRRRLELVPGLTCIWQVEGGTRVTFDEWMRMDLRYIQARSAARDLGLLWRTFTKVLLHRASR